MFTKWIFWALCVSSLFYLFFNLSQKYILISQLFKPILFKVHKLTKKTISGIIYLFKFIKFLKKNLLIRGDIGNGRKILNAEELDFMTPEKVAECLIELKTKNCKGYNRLPLRILKDGASILVRPLSILFSKIYERK